MAKIVVSASSMPAGRNMSSQLEYVKRMQTYGADMYHLDIMDGVFVKNQTIDHTYMPELRRNSVIMFDVHLMIANPEKYIKKYALAGAGIITIHVEAFDEKEKLINALQTIKKYNVMAGLCIDLPSKVDIITPYLDYADLILVMTVKAGAGGQTFDETALKKIKQIKKIKKEVLIEVDGGIDDITAPLAVKAGADILVSGSYIYENDAFSAIQTLKGK